MTRHDVVVVGGGPAGSSTAALLAQRGYAVLLVDRAIFPREKACAEYCSPGVEDVLRRTGAWSMLDHAVRRVPGMVIHIGGRAVLPVQYTPGANRRFAFTLPRRQLDAILVDHARRSGVEVVEGVRVYEVSRSDGEIAVRGFDRSGATSSWQSRVVVAADGLHSTTAESLGIHARPHWPLRLGLITHFDGYTPVRGQGEMHVGPGVYCGLAPLPNRLVNVGLVVSMKLARQLRHQDFRRDSFPPTGGGVSGSLLGAGLSMLPAAARRLGDGMMVKPVRGMGPMTRRVEKVAGRGFLLVGDAAGFLDPFTGEGLFRALRGAELAAETIDRGLRSANRAEPPDMSGYAVRRRDEFAGKACLTWLIQLALSSPALFGHLCRNLSASPVAAQLMGAALGDVGPASTLMRPGVVAALLTPAAVRHLPLTHLADSETPFVQKSET